MTKLPVISGRKCIRALEKIDFYIPEHKELDRGTLRSIIRTAGISVEEFVKLLK